MFNESDKGITRRRFIASLGAGAAACCAGRLAWGGQLADADLHEAKFYEPLAGKKIRCGLCPRGCIVPDKGRGYCRVRENRGGKFYTLVYGRPCAVHLDPIEKKPFFHVYPGSKSYSISTVGCNINCKFCQNWDISQASPEDVSVSFKAPGEIAEAAVKAHARTMAYTYGEPAVFAEYMADCAAAGKKEGVESVMVSNGFISGEALKSVLPVLKAVKIDLKSFTQSFYADVCEGQLQPVLDTLRRLAESGVWHEIVVLIIPSLNDNSDEIKRMSAWIVKELGPDVPLHFSRFTPMYKMRNIAPTPVETLRRARRIAMEEGVNFVYIGNVPGEESQNTICPFCKTILIRRYQYSILENNIAGGRCGKCKRPVPGVWS
ncbi:MAG: AmmeMemoRadiSam system radical SAM enzyme [Kiritimatiellae bacterium]|jgi:pyruvate formate lyase activating enzyme|nr:AmmeMemoRadiSam system radical SAM enzyme [Kiritimatiellia bacterium]